MREHVKLVCALIGVAGAQILTIVLFALFAEPCIDALPSVECLWGMTFGEYWATYGTGMSAFFAVVGGFIGSELELSSKAS